MGSVTAVTEILGSRKDFAGRWVGNPRLNRLGLHPARIAASELCLVARRRQLAPLGAPPWAEELSREGIVVRRSFLEPGVFEDLRQEARDALDSRAAEHPPPPPEQRGFGEQRPFPGGFDRYDGGTLNRYLEIDPQQTPRTAEALAAPALRELCAWASGFRHRPDRFWIYETVHEVEPDNPDIQKALHKDTFHSTVKLWLYLDEVREQDGPFVYVPGSHRMTRARYRWEYRRALAACAPGAKRRGGAFRVEPEELAELGLPAPRTYPVPANTLVLADVRGFHRRGDAEPGARRLSLYANLRRWPFSPVAY